MELFPGRREAVERSWKFSFAEMDLSGFLSDFYETGQIRLAAEPLGKDYLLHGELLAPLVLECSRCGEAFQQALRVPLNWTVHRVPEATLEEDLAEGEFEMRLEDQELDFTARLREIIIFNLPAKPLCRADCRGLCSSCGKNLNLESCACRKDSPDPRWDELRRLSH